MTKKKKSIANKSVKKPERAREPEVCRVKRLPTLSCHTLSCHTLSCHIVMSTRQDIDIDIHIHIET